MAVARSVQPVIVDMRLAHLPGVLDIERRSFPTPWSERAFVSELTQNAYAHYVVAMCGARVAAYGGMWLVLDEAHVTNIAVHPRFRHQGIGEAVLSALEARARTAGCVRMTLEVRPSNEVAQHLYRKHGFVPCGRRPGYYTDTQEDAIVMCKEGFASVAEGGPIATDHRGTAPPEGDGKE